MTAISCDLAELDRMVSDAKQTGPLYRPGQYWQKYCDQNVSAIRSDRLNSFRIDPRYDGFGDAQLFADYLWSYRAAKFVINNVLGPLKKAPRIGPQLTLID